MSRGNPQNLLKPTDLSPEQQRMNAQKAGIESGKVRKRTSDLRKAIQVILDGSYNVYDETGDLKVMTGIEIIAMKIFKEAITPKSRNWGKAVDTVLKLTGADTSPEQLKKAKAEIKLIQAKIKQIEQGSGAGVDVEDLTTLAKLLNLGLLQT